MSQWSFILRQADIRSRKLNFLVLLDFLKSCNSFERKTLYWRSNSIGKQQKKEFSIIFVFIMLKIWMEVYYVYTPWLETNFQSLWRNEFLTIVALFFPLKSYYNHAASADFHRVSSFCTVFFHIWDYKCGKFILNSVQIR